MATNGLCKTTPPIYKFTELSSVLFLPASNNTYVKDDRFVHGQFSRITRNSEMVDIDQGVGIFRYGLYGSWRLNLGWIQASYISF